MNIIYVGFSDKQFFVLQDLKFSSVIFHIILTSISYKYVCIFFFSFTGFIWVPVPLTVTIFNAICKTRSKSLIPPLSSAHASSPFSLFPTYQEQDEGSE